MTGNPQRGFVRSQGKAESRTVRGTMISASMTGTVAWPGRDLQVGLADTVPPYLRALLAQVEPFPAAVRDGRWQLLAFNRSYDALFGLTPMPPPSRNALLLYFTDPRLRAQWPDWELDAGHLVSQFRAALARHPGDPAWAQLLDRLRRGSPEFDRRWPDGWPFHPGHGPQRFRHPVVGPLRLTPYQLWSDPHPDGLVATGYTPADAATAAKLRTLSEV
jgi:MmyB-like transcription regulator ligand binding domain